ncbi:disease resistance protein RFL1-like [Silene latifolia]|uniref:disease resistance protein RFL1-like n=1 Tax=Silene latifolia TaxID=37657 RepID=UPI003D788E86
MIELLSSITAGLFVTVVIFLVKECLILKDVAETIESLKNVLDFVGNFPKWLRYYSDLNANVLKLEDRKSNLQYRLNDLQQRVENEEHRTGRTRKKEVQHWIDTAESKLADVKAVLLTIDQGTNRFTRFVVRAWWGNQVENLIVEVDDLYHLGVFEEVLSTVRETAELPLTTLVGTAAIENIKKITTWLAGNGVTKIGVHGTKGIGKTALMKHIHNKLLSYGKIHVYMVTIPEDCHDYQLQSAIAGAVGVDLQEEDLVRRAALLCRALKMRNFVLILDGLTRYFALENVGIPLDNARGKIIITSRSTDVCRRMGCQNHSIAVTPLPSEEALDLFKMKLHCSSFTNPRLEAVASQIVAECKGVALKIVEKASDLIGIDDLSVWLTVFKEMQEA